MVNFVSFRESPLKIVPQVDLISLIMLLSRGLRDGPVVSVLDREVRCSIPGQGIHFVRDFCFQPPSQLRYDEYTDRTLNQWEDETVRTGHPPSYHHHNP